MADIDRLIGFMAIMQVPFMNDPDALAYIEEVKTVLKQAKAQEPGWISVKDRMPEYDKEVLIYAVSKTTNESKIAISYLMDKFYFGSRPINLKEPIWHEPWQYFGQNNTITHWMPLPTPPEEKCNDD